MTGLSVALAFGSSGGFVGVPSLSAIGLSTFGAVLVPAVICDNSLAETMSTETESTEAFSSGRAANEMTLAPRTTTWAITETT